VRIVIFCHSLLSDWNHGNAHFLRGVATELTLRGHAVAVYEPADAWSLQHLRAHHGEECTDAVRAVYPHLAISQYDAPALDLDRVLHGAELVLVHEWNDPALVASIGAHRARGGGYRLLFHDTHHRAVSDPAAMAGDPLDAYDGVLAFGEALRERYLALGWSRRVWTWHEAADTRVFRPMPHVPRDRDLVWVGNWGDEERAAELDEFLVQPARRLRLKADVYGVRYPEEAQRALHDAGLIYAGWVANFEVPRLFAGSGVTVHVPRRPYLEMLPGIPTIRLFEAMACGIPLVSARWRDVEGLFVEGSDYLLARTGYEMERHLTAIFRDQDLSRALAEHGRRTVLARHTCAHRVDELLAIHQTLEDRPQTCAVA
jgi:spore maturation protein CgeB